MEENIKISIITASYNYRDLIQETIKSVQAQTYENWEMIIVDDGSKDNSVEVIKQYCENDSRIKLFQHEGGINKGLCKTVQLGIEKANTEWIAFLESDDLILPDYLEEKVKVIKSNSDIDFIFNDVETLGERAENCGYEEYFKDQKEVIKKLGNPADYFDVLGERNYVPTFSVVMIKKSIMNTLDYSTDGGQPQLDWYLWRQTALNHKFYYIDKKLTKWRLHNASYISSSIPEIQNIIFEFNYYKLCLKRKKFFKHLPKLYKMIKRFIFRFHPKEGKLLFLGKWFYFKKRKEQK